MSRLEQIEAIEHYCDLVPRRRATVQEHGPFRLFIGDRTNPLYARPVVGGSPTVRDIELVRMQQRELGAPEAFEWIDALHPGLADLMQSTGLVVAHHPLQSLSTLKEPTAILDEVEIRIVGADDPEVELVSAVIGAAFSDRDEIGSIDRDPERRTTLADRSFVLVGAFVQTAEGIEIAGGGAHSPRGRTTELTGIGIAPRHRGRGIGSMVTATLAADALQHGADTVFLSAGSERTASLYSRLGFETLAAACVAEAVGDSSDPVNR